MAGKAKALRGLLDFAGVDEPRNVFPAPQRMFDPEDRAYKPFLEPFGPTPGGRYLQMGPGGPQDITGQYPEAAMIGVGPDGRPQFQVSQGIMDQIPELTEGRKVKTNLFKRKAGWKWTQVPDGYPAEPDSGFPLVSVEDGKQHYYTLQTQFPKGVELSRYENSPTEPRLRPTRKGGVALGNQVGEIEVRGKKHPVYDRIQVYSAPAATATGVGGILGQMMGEDEAMY